MQFLWKYIDDLVGKGLSIPIISKLLLFTSASLVPMALPLAILLASLMTFGNLGENYELIALKSSGVSLQKIMRPLIILSLVLAFGAFFFSNYALPYTNLKMRTLLYDIQRQRPELQIKEGVFYNGIDGYSIKIGKKDPKTNLLHDIRIYNHSEKRGNINVTVADSGYMMMTGDEGNLILTLYSGCSYIDIRENSRARNQRRFPFRRDKFSKQTTILQLVGFGLVQSDESIYKSNYQMMNLSQLKSYEDSIKSTVNFNKNELNRQMQEKQVKDKYTPAINRIKPKDLSNQPHAILNADSLMADLNIFEQRRIYDRALQLARNRKGIIRSSFATTDYQERKMRKYQIEWHRKFTLSFACIVFFFIGAPLGAIIRKGGLGMPVIVSVLFFVFYYILSLTGEKFVREGVLPGYQGMWLSSLVLFIAGSFLTYKATSDSAMFNIDTYFSFFKRIGALIKRFKKVKA